MKKLFTFVALFSSLTIFAQIPTNYYSLAEGKSGIELKTALHNIIRNHKPYSYSGLEVQMRYTDEDPNNTNNVILLYTGWSYPKSANGGGTTDWNKEHTWAKSQGDFGTSLGPGSDLHHLRPTDVTVNSKRGSLMFDNGGSLYTDPSRLGGGDGNTGCYVDGDSWEAADRVKGDVARMLFYMAVRYEKSGSTYYDNVNLELAENSSTSGLHGKFSTLLQWNANDLVSDWEKRRNDRIYELQNNRNPFIDHPELVDYIWGNKVGNPWYSNGDGGGGEEPGCQNLNFSAPFTSSMSPFTEYSASGDQQWSWRSANYGVVMSGYVSGTNYANEDWLVSPSINLENYNNIQLSFDHTINKGDVSKMLSENTLWISNDYNGDVSTATWEQIPITQFPTGSDWTFVNSGYISIPPKNAQKNTHIAFKYTCSIQSSSTWEIKNLSITGVCGATSIKNELIQKKYPVSTFHNSITIYNLENEAISIYDIYGRNVASAKNIIGNTTINVPISGVYIVKINSQTIKVIVK